ncbi:MAG: thiamine phosphate synthase [Hyphomicrobiaceae bacterium]
MTGGVLDVFYPILPSAGWVERLVPLGIRTVQLRFKEGDAAAMRREIAVAQAVCRAHGSQLIVNDDWAAAIDLNCDWVHLGQEDLASADLPAIRRSGLRLGISTHSEEELEIALAAGPDYVALGPVYETRLKVMKWAPQGLDRVARWKKRIGSLPLVAIGGLTPERAPAVLAAGADSLAVITDFMTAPDPAARLGVWLSWAGEARRPGYR